jgi:hypothetical protein
MELIEKAWIIKSDCFDEPWFIPEDIFYGTRGQAKKAALIELDGWKDKFGDEITFLNTPIVRHKAADKYLLNGEVKTMSQIETDRKYQERKERLNALIEADPTAKAYIIKGGYYYRPNSCGYTERRDRAGVYTIQEAVESVLGCSLRDHMDVIVINKEEHNQMIHEEINELKARIIA